MAKNELIFERYEKKYRLTREQYEALLPRLREKMHEDEYSHGTVCSIYYDTDSYDMIRRSIEKPRYKEKLRVRSYGAIAPDGRIYIEIKKKYNKVVYKRRVSARADQLADFWAGRIDLPDSPQIQREIRWLYEHYKPSPKVFIGYERYALYGTENPELRITFDTNLRWRTDRLSLTEGDFGAPLLPGDDRILMEVKTGRGMPVWLSKLFSELGILPGSFSKVGTCYTKYIAKSILKEEE